MVKKVPVTPWWRITCMVPAAILGILVRITTLLTLTLWHPRWELSFLFWRTRAKHRWQQRKYR